MQKWFAHCLLINISHSIYLSVCSPLSSVILSVCLSIHPWSFNLSVCLSVCLLVSIFCRAVCMCLSVALFPVLLFLFVILFFPFLWVESSPSNKFVYQQSNGLLSQLSNEESIGICRNFSGRGFTNLGFPENSKDPREPKTSKDPTKTKFRKFSGGQEPSVDSPPPPRVDAHYEKARYS